MPNFTAPVGLQARNEIHDVALLQGALLILKNHKRLHFWDGPVDGDWRRHQQSLTEALKKLEAEAKINNGPGKIEANGPLARTLKQLLPPQYQSLSAIPGTACLTIKDPYGGQHKGPALKDLALHDQCRKDLERLIKAGADKLGLELVIEKEETDHKGRCVFTLKPHGVKCLDARLNPRALGTPTPRPMIEAVAKQAASATTLDVPPHGSKLEVKTRASQSQESRRAKDERIKHRAEVNKQRFDAQNFEKAADFILNENAEAIQLITVQLASTAVAGTPVFRKQVEQIVRQPNESEKRTKTFVDALRNKVRNGQLLGSEALDELHGVLDKELTQALADGSLIDLGIVTSHGGVGNIGELRDKVAASITRGKISDGRAVSYSELSDSAKLRVDEIIAGKKLEAVSKLTTSTRINSKVAAGLWVITFVSAAVSISEAKDQKTALLRQVLNIGAGELLGGVVASFVRSTFGRLAARVAITGFAAAVGVTLFQGLVILTISLALGVAISLVTDKIPDGIFDD